MKVICSILYQLIHWWCVVWAPWAPQCHYGMILDSANFLRLLAPESKVWGEAQEWSHGITFWLFLTRQAYTNRIWISFSHTTCTVHFYWITSEFSDSQLFLGGFASEWLIHLLLRTHICFSLALPNPLTQRSPSITTPRVPASTRSLLVPWESTWEEVMSAWCFSYLEIWGGTSTTELLSGWWFQIFVIFSPIWGRFPFWLIFFRWVETTN